MKQRLFFSFVNHHKFCTGNVFSHMSQQQYICFKSKENCYFKKMIKPWNPLIYFSIRRLCSGIFSKLLFFLKEEIPTHSADNLLFLQTDKQYHFCIGYQRILIIECVFILGVGGAQNLKYKVLKKIKMVQGSSKVIEFTLWPKSPKTLRKSLPTPGNAVGDTTAQGLTTVREGTFSEAESALTLSPVPQESLPLSLRKEGHWQKKSSKLQDG